MEPAGDASVELAELLAAFGRPSEGTADRHDVMAQFLSAGEGWRDAKAALRGTFASTAVGETGLTDAKEQ